jgi:hypothetical protein
VQVLVLEIMDYQHLTKVIVQHISGDCKLKLDVHQDRSLGYVELPIKGLAKQNADNHEYPFESTGMQTTQGPIRLSGDRYKGTLHYVAEFLPAFNLRGLTFESLGTEMDRNQADGVESGEDVARGDQSDANTEEDDGRIPNEVITRAQKSDGVKKVPPQLTPITPITPSKDNREENGSKPTEDRASVISTSTRNTKPPTNSAGSVTPTGIEMPYEQLLKQRKL